MQDLHKKFCFKNDFSSLIETLICTVV